MADLLLTRFAGREREITIRSDLGASRTRLLRRIPTECLVLGMLAGLAPLAAARQGFDWLIAMYPDSVPRLMEARDVKTSAAPTPPERSITFFPSDRDRSPRPD